MRKCFQLAQRACINSKNGKHIEINEGRVGTERERAARPGRRHQLSSFPGGGRAPSPAEPLTWLASGSLHSRPRGAVRRGPGRPRRLRGGAAPRRTHRPRPPPPPLRLPPTAGPAIPRPPLPAEPAAPHPPPPPRCLAVGTVLAERPPCGQSQNMGLLAVSSSSWTRKPNREAKEEVSGSFETVRLSVPSSPSFQ
ncbi:submaxillary gland androgen-regulated protein 3A-like [Mastomys coucha]|uniref:submaxillary gland androgen-regulated protein 3A-like n=1 Tax=Mastomys coucha TaxID=35658 RepID=UPI001261FBFE|nr:submaxillary gland androgen-regulated protein 3A-like [Mastomys coucha]